MKNKLWIFGLCALFSCDYLQSLREKDAPVEEPIARVYNKMLYPKDLKGIVPVRTNAEDSSNMVQRFVDAWVKKQMMQHVAEQNTDLDQAEITRRMEDYKYDLLVYAYEKQLIQQKLDTVVTKAQILEYYEENKANFELRQNIVKGFFLKVPKDARRVVVLKRWLANSDISKNIDEIREYAVNSSSSYHLGDSSWIDFDDLIINTPFTTELPNKIQTLRNQKFLETSDDTYLYFVRILEYKISSETSPLEFVKEQIADIILNKRRIELRKKHEDEILKQAKQDDNYEIFE